MREGKGEGLRQRRVRGRRRGGERERRKGGRVGGGVRGGQGGSEGGSVEVVWRPWSNAGGWMCLQVGRQEIGR